MTRLPEKIRLIFVPFVVICVGFIACYTYLHWLLLIKYHLFAMQDDVANIFVPLGLSWLPIIIWLVPRTKLIPLVKNSDRPRFGVQTLAWLAIAAPTILAQLYLGTATGRLTPLDNIEQLSHVAATKYYTVQHSYVDKIYAGGYYSSQVSGKHSEDLNFHIHFVLPIFADTADTVLTQCAAWLGVAYDKRVSNKLTDAEKEEKWKAFVEESQKKFEEKDVHDFTYLARAGNDDDHTAYLKALKESPKFKGANDVILLAAYEPFDARNGSVLLGFFISLGGGALLFLIVVLCFRLDEDELAKRISGHPSENADGRLILSYFIPHKKLFITPILIDINILVFALMVCKGTGFVDISVGDLEAWGGNYRSHTMHGEWWRLLTSTFVHAGIMHLFMNMIGLLLVGIILEPVVGKAKYAIAYLLTGVIASAASLYWHTGDVVSVGASGAIFGLYGMLTALLLTKVFPKEFSKGVLIFMAIFIGYNLLAGLAGGTDNAAHIGGLVCGLIIGFILHATIRPVTEEEIKELEREQMTDGGGKTADEG